MQAVPVLLVTQDDALWQHWRQIDALGWLPARGHALQDIARWGEAQRGLVVIDADLPRLPAWNDAAWQAVADKTRILIGSGRLDDAEATRALAMGAWGYFHAYVPATALAHILQTVSLGEIWIGRSLVQRLLRQVSQVGTEQAGWMSGLTEREIDVARRAAGGISNQGIADELGISERTVRAHLSAIFEKLGVTDRLALALKVHGIQHA
ncbi:response regulator transcription factor [Corticimicrobacter populi]|uniref:Helix-turn-helix transcriptional regulator n=1 Tax=Corticimicrobacter populi TaxID=2175229 RepID=A0A2V1JWK5_9BURK|nr:response regulator transcription factor [Corticimicrobacter populi]PWF21740.1 helix-turn-helix transcriptional regulator [Corticimicrobacter populi]